MTREETIKILMLVQAGYPNYKPQDKTVTVDFWNEMLADYSYQQISQALKTYITTDTSGFAPSIGQLIDKVKMIEQPQELTEMEAWALVSRALRNGYYGAEQEFAKLPQLVQKTVGQPSQLKYWAVTDQDSIENVVQSNFMRSYRVVVAREKETAKLPTEIKALIESNRKNQMLEQQTRVLIETKKEEQREGVPMPNDLKEQLMRLFS